MKLAEALQERADLNRKLEQLRCRLMNNALTQEGEKPAEEPGELLKTFNECAARLEELIARINRTNCETLVEGKSITDMIARRDCLTVRLSAYRDVISTASQSTQRATRTEIKILPTVNVRELQRQADELSKELRLLDNRIQEQNWLTELK